MPVSLTHVTRRNLPHWQREGAVYWVTFRLADSLPQTKLTQLRAEKEAWQRKIPEPWTLHQQREYQAQFDERVQQWLDAGYGDCALARPDVRQVVRAGLTRFDGIRLQLHAAVIMPNHVHALIQPRAESDTGIPAGDALPRLLKGIKGASARTANQLLGRTGPFWMDETYDRIVRDQDEHAHFVNYIRANPAKAGLPERHYWVYVA